MKKQESLLSKKFSKQKIDLHTIFGGVTTSEGTGDCHGTGCSEMTGQTDTNPGVKDWADIECGDDNIAGSVKCPL